MVYNSEKQKFQNKKNIIFHLPWDVNIDLSRTGYIRSSNLINAFESKNYNVDIVMGKAKKRKNQIDKIKDNIKKGKKYEFLYSESSTYPTVLSSGNKDAIRYPLLDFRFFSFCKKKKIKIGLFYRDIFWRFNTFSVSKHWLKKYYYQFLYKFDLNQYHKNVDILYMPSTKMVEYLPFKLPIVKSLPPGCKINEKISDKDNKKISILYIGGIGGHYKIHKLVKVISEKPKYNLTICCRKDSWEKNKKEYKKFLNSNINIVHLSGKDLYSLFKKNNIAVIFIEKLKYWDFVMPMKLYEYMSHHIPIIGTSNTSVGNFISENDIGWSIPYNEKSLIQLLEKIEDNYNILKEKQKNIKKILPDHSWDSRADQIINDLTKD